MLSPLMEAVFAAIPREDWTSPDSRPEAHVVDFATAPWRGAEPNTSDDVALADRAGDEDLHAFDGAVHEANGTAGGAFLAHDVPGLEGVAEFEGEAAVGDVAVDRETELEVRVEPLRFEVEAGLVELINDAGEILPDEVREHETIVQAGAPADKARRQVGLFPKTGDEGAQEELLREAHAGVGRHLEGA